MELNRNRRNRRALCEKNTILHSMFEKLKNCIREHYTHTHTRTQTQTYDSSTFTKTHAALVHKQIADKQTNERMGTHTT